MASSSRKSLASPRLLREDLVVIATIGQGDKRRSDRSAIGGRLARPRLLELNDRRLDFGRWLCGKKRDIRDVKVARCPYRGTFRGREIVAFDTYANLWKLAWNIKLVCLFGWLKVEVEFFFVNESQYCE